MTLAAEITESSLALDSFVQEKKPLAVVFGNEVVGVEPETLKLVDAVVHIPMQ